MLKGTVIEGNKECLMAKKTNSKLVIPPWTVIMSLGGGICQIFSNKYIISAGSVSTFNLKYWALYGCGPPESIDPFTQFLNCLWSVQICEFLRLQKPLLWKFPTHFPHSSRLYFLVSQDESGHVDCIAEGLSTIPQFKQANLQTPRWFKDLLITKDVDKNAVLAGMNPLFDIAHPTNWFLKNFNVLSNAFIFQLINPFTQMPPPPKYSHKMENRSVQNAYKNFSSIFVCPQSHSKWWIDVSYGICAHAMYILRKNSSNLATFISELEQLHRWTGDTQIWAKTTCRTNVNCATNLQWHIKITS